jgi:hypothetical protein
MNGRRPKQTERPIIEGCRGAVSSFQVIRILCPCASSLGPRLRNEPANLGCPSNRPLLPVRDIRGPRPPFGHKQSDACPIAHAPLALHEECVYPAPSFLFLTSLSPAPRYKECVSDPARSIRENPLVCYANCALFKDKPINSSVNQSRSASLPLPFQDNGGEEDFQSE